VLQHIFTLSRLDTDQVILLMTSCSVTGMVSITSNACPLLIRHCQNLTIMDEKSLCLSVCLSAPSSAFPIGPSRGPRPRRLSPWALITCPPSALMGSLRGRGLSCRVFFPRWFCQVYQYSAQTRGDIWWMTPLKGPSLRPYGESGKLALSSMLSGVIVWKLLKFPGL